MSSTCATLDPTLGETMKRFAIICATALLTAGAAQADATKPHLDTSGANLQPNYPATALDAKETGEVLLDVAVTPGGTVEKIALRRSTGFNDLDRAAISAVINWYFVPAMENGAPVEGQTIIALTFAPTGSEFQPTASTPVQDYLPSAIEQKAEVGTSDVLRKEIPCGAGTISTSLKMTIPREAIPEGQPVGSSISLHLGNDQKVTLETVVDRWTNYTFLISHWDGNKWSETHIFHVKPIGDVPLSLSWDISGNVSTEVGVDRYSVKIANSPDAFQLSTWGAKALWKNTLLTCSE